MTTYNTNRTNMADRQVSIQIQTIPAEYQMKIYEFDCCAKRTTDQIKIYINKRLYTTKTPELRDLAGCRNHWMSGDRWLLAKPDQQLSRFHLRNVKT